MINTISCFYIYSAFQTRLPFRQLKIHYERVHERARLLSCEIIKKNVSEI